MAHQQSSGWLTWKYDAVILQPTTSTFPTMLVQYKRLVNSKKKKLTSNGMNSRHQTLNDTKVVIDDLIYENRHH